MCTSEAPCFAAARRISLRSKGQRSFRRRPRWEPPIPRFERIFFARSPANLRMLPEEQAGVLPPCPIRSPPTEYHAPLFSTTSCSPESRMSLLPGDPFP